jgi:tetratricopeptide (TPR) repeat protein
MKSATEEFLAGVSLLKHGFLRDAADVAEDALEVYPDDGPLWELLGVACQRDARHMEAREALETASLLKPLDTGARFCLAEAYAATGLYDMAVFVFRMVSDDPQTPTWLLPRIASHLGQMQEHADALEVCQLILKRDDARHDAHFGVGFYLRRMGAPVTQVLTSIMRAHELAPEVSLYRVVAASLLEEQGQHEDAYDLLRGLSPETIQCPESLRRMMTVFRTARDLQGLWDCARCLKKLDNSVASSNSSTQDDEETDC